jgi:DNA-directed RNA polymerase specialized sigma24 family protein
MDDRTVELPPAQGVASRIFMRGRKVAFKQANCLGGAARRRTIGDLRTHWRLVLFKTPSTSEGFIRLRPIPQRFSPRLLKREVIVTSEISSRIELAARLESSGAAARVAGDESAAEAYYREALGLAVKAAERAAENSSRQALVERLRVAVRLALNCGDVSEGRRLMEDALRADPSIAGSDGWTQLRDVAAWPDAWLVAALHRDPPDAAALDALADRHWKPLFGRCHLLTLNHDKAGDLAQEAWCRVLRASHGLKPGGNFPAYLMTTATNIWRDWHRWSQRAGPMADEQLASLDESLSTQDGGNIVLAEVLPDLNSLQAEEVHGSEERQSLKFHFQVSEARRNESYEEPRLETIT